MTLHVTPSRLCRLLQDGWWVKTLEAGRLSTLVTTWLFAVCAAGGRRADKPCSADARRRGPGQRDQGRGQAYALHGYLHEATPQPVYPLSLSPLR